MRFEHWNNYPTTCDSCHKHRRITKEYGIITGQGYEWADSISESYCLKCIIKMDIDNQIYKIKKLLTVFKTWYEINKELKGKKLTFKKAYKLFYN